MSSTKPSPIEENSDGTITVCFDSKVTPLDAIKKSAYKFAKDCAVVVSADSTSYRAHITFFGKPGEEQKTRLVGAFCNEVIDQELREKIAEKTELTRNLILAQAFSKTKLLQND